MFTINPLGYLLMLLKTVCEMTRKLRYICNDASVPIYVHLNYGFPHKCCATVQPLLGNLSKNIQSLMQLI